MSTNTPRTDALIFAPNGNYFSASTADYRDLCRILERELAEAKAMQLSQAKEWEALRAENAALQARLAQDAARLIFVTQHGVSVFDTFVEGDPQWEVHAWGRSYRGPTVRAAIDAARKGQIV